VTKSACLFGSRSRRYGAAFVVLLLAHVAVAAQIIAGSHDPRTKRGPLILHRGPDLQEVHFPRDEELGYSVTIRLGVLGEHEVGTVTMTSRVSAFFPEDVDPLSVDADHELEQALVSARAVGSYEVYSVDELISTEFLPQSWPKLVHRSVQTGTENRRRELSLGTKDGASTASYRGDGHCKGCEDDAHFVEPTFFWNGRYHCKDCNRGEHRVWKQTKLRPVPEGSIDMVTAVMLARTVVQQGKSKSTFLLADRDKMWQVDISRGKRDRRKVGAGNFDMVEVVLSTRPPEGETGRDEDFKGLFGLHGNISIWMHPESGVPVEITGMIPVGPLELDVRIELERYRGTPESFRPVVK
jgi:hypothetical protein